MLERQTGKAIGPDGLLSAGGEIGIGILDSEDLQCRVLLGDQERRLVDEAAVFIVPVVQHDVAEPGPPQFAEDVLEQRDVGGGSKRQGPRNMLSAPASRPRAVAE